LEHKNRIYDVYLQIGIASLEEQFRRGQSLDTRAATVAAIAGVLTGIAAVLVKDYSYQGLGSITVGIALFLVAGSFTSAIVNCLRVINPRRSWYTYPPLDQLNNRCDPLGSVRTEIASAVSSNEYAINAKLQPLKWAIPSIMVMGLSTLGLGITIAFFPNSVIDGTECFPIISGVA